MAKVDARRCDNEQCGDLVLADAVVTVRTSFRGAGMNGSHTRELCKPCAEEEVPSGVELVVPKTRGVKDEPEEPSTT